jgi:hypothetical protein
MIRMKSLLLPIISAAILAFAPLQGQADTPGRHPFYLHARSDLRTAQWISRGSEDPNVTRRLHEADQEIEAAIHEIDRASVLDHKDLNDHPHIDEKLTRSDRFRKMMELLQKSRADIGREEDNPSAIGLRDLAYRHIDKAMELVHRAARDLRIDRDLGW